MYEYLCNDNDEHVCTIVGARLRRIPPRTAAAARSACVVLVLHTDRMTPPEACENVGARALRIPRLSSLPLW
jgi:hypothetical protein